MKKLVIYISSILLVFMISTAVTFGMVTSNGYGNNQSFIPSYLLGIIKEAGLIGLGIGAVASIIWLIIEARKMKTVSINYYAGTYSSDLNLTHRHDHFLYRSTSRRKIETNDNHN